MLKIRGMEALPLVQGGMGVGISDWRLAHAVSERGQLGVVSGTALDELLARRLQFRAPWLPRWGFQKWRT